METIKHFWAVLRDWVGFALKVLRDFKRNQGILLSGAIAYYTFLSIVPMALLAMIVLSHLLPEDQLLPVLSGYISLIIPGYAGALTAQVQSYFEHRNVVGAVGLGAMLFFSSIAFSMLENAMTLIFFQHFPERRRHLLVSAVIPYIYLALIAFGIVVTAYLVSALESVAAGPTFLFGWGFSLEMGTGIALYLAGIVGEFIFLSSIYLVMPAVRVSLRYALIGGLTATILWELMRRALIWYYGVMSMVKLIYGPIAIAVSALLCVEVAAIIILLGAQVIAELVSKRVADGDGAAEAGSGNGSV